MSGSKNVSSSGGIGVVGLLGVVFVALKLTGIIDWSWWWVTAPFWGGFALLIVILAVFFGGAGAIIGLEALAKKFKN